MKRAKPIVAIDGPVGVGKSSVAQQLAKQLGYLYIDTGAMYRAITLKAMRSGIDLENKLAVTEIAYHTELHFERHDGILRIFCDGLDVSEEIRNPEVSAGTSAVADNEEVRKRLVAVQQEMGKHGGLVMEGRDIGTVVFPDAEVKIYLDADPKIRARRRYDQDVAKGKKITFEETYQSLLQRDERDKNRKVGALKKADDAIVVDTSHLSEDEVIDELHKIVTNTEYHQ